MHQPRRRECIICLKADRNYVSSGLTETPSHCSNALCISAPAKCGILMHNLGLTVIVFALFFYSCSSGKKINQIKNGQQHGLWITYADAGKKIILNKGRFKNGIPQGKWVYNNTKGQLDRKEVYRGKKIKIKHFHGNGKCAVSGKAELVNEENKLHFYYYGKWKYYDENGRHEKTALFEKGRLVKEDYLLKNKNQDYAKLTIELDEIGKSFDFYNNELNRITSEKGAKSDEYNVALAAKNKNDSLLFKKLDSIVTKHGYPSKEQVGEKNGVIFYIVSFAKWQIKERYVDVFRKAALNKDISNRDLAYFEDKYYYAKEGYQLYGTFSYHDKRTNNYVYYPVTDIQNLNERRKLRDLEPVNISLYMEK